MKKHFNSIHIKFNLIPFLVILLLIGSCNKSEEFTGVIGGAVLNVSLDGISYDEEEQLFEKKSSTREGYSTGVIKDTTIVYKEHMMDVLVESDNGQQPSSLGRGKVQTNAKGFRAITKPLEPNIKYMLMVFNPDGSFKTQKEYTYGAPKVSDSIRVDSKVKYTIVAYSINSTSALPQVTYGGGAKNLANAQIQNITADFMAEIRQNVEFVPGDNKLGIIMKHKFSTITTKLTMDSKMTGGFNTLSNAKIGAVYPSATFKLASGGSLIYNTPQETYANVIFPSFVAGQREVISSPTLLINPATTDRTFQFGTIKIDDETKTNLSIPGIKINPGKRYNLTFNFRTCTQEATLGADNLNWDYPELAGQKGCVDNSTNPPTQYLNGTILTKTFSAPASNYGFTFDITKLDNAINMSVNGRMIFGTTTNDQIQFQTYDNTANGEGIITRNIKFIDNTEYGTGSIPEIWKIFGTTAKPMIRIVISKTGVVTMFGSKSSEGNLVQLVLKSGSFNNVPWNASGNNTIIVSQKVSNATAVVGRGSGQVKVGCPTS